MLRFVLKLIGISVVVFGLHLGSQYIFESIDDWNGAPFNLLQIYFVEFLISLLTIIAISAIQKVSFNNTGFVFLGFVTLRLVASYIFIKPLLEMGEAFEFIKFHFLLIFFVYLTFDVYVTFVLLKENDDVEKNKTKQ